MIRKLLTKPIWQWERKRSYPVRLRYSQLPPLPVCSGGVRYVVLTTPDSLIDALWAAWSWYRFLGHHGFELQLAVDGKLTPTAKMAARNLFPGIAIYEAASVLAPLSEREPGLAKFLRGHPLGNKLGLVLALSEQGSLLFSDHDVLAFQEPAELLSYADQEIPCYFLEEADGTRDAAIVECANSLGVQYLPRFNSGLLYVPKDSLSAKLAVELLRHWQPPANCWYTEQTVLSILMRSAHAQPLPDSRYVVSNRRQFYWDEDVDYGAIAARHFTGTVRHVMYRYGMPAILRQSRGLKTAVMPVETRI